MIINVSVVIPIYNEEEILQELYKRITENVKKIADNYEIIFVNDGSKDNSINLIKEISIKDNSVKYINFTRNFGHQTAVTSGLNLSKGENVIIIDGDLQDPPEIFPELYEKRKMGYNVVYAKRKKRKGDSVFKKITAKYFYRILAKLTDIEIPLDTGDYRLISRDVVENLKLMPETNKFLRGQIAWLGYKSTYVEFDRDGRRFGDTGYPLSKMLKFAIDGITAFSNIPLKIATYVGLTVSAISFLIILYALYSKYILHDVVDGWSSIIISITFIGGVQLLTIGIIGEYLGRIGIDVKKRPLYIIEETNIEETNTEETNI